jgi:hypothetical protein
VTGGVQTRDLRGHVPALYRLSYGHSALGWIRTSDQPLRTRLLCPLSYEGEREVRAGFEPAIS